MNDDVRGNLSIDHLKFCVQDSFCSGWWSTVEIANDHAIHRAIHRGIRQRVTYDNIMEPGGVCGFMVGDSDLVALVSHEARLHHTSGDSK